MVIGVQAEIPVKTAKTLLLKEQHVYYQFSWKGRGEVELINVYATDWQETQISRKSAWLADW